MSVEDINLTKNDSLPSVQYTIGRTGSGSTTPNLTGCTVHLKVRGIRASTNKFTLSVTSSGNNDGQITYPTSGVVRLDWTTGRWNSSGTFVGEISYATSAGKVETVPDRQIVHVESEF